MEHYLAASRIFFMESWASWVPVHQCLGTGLIPSIAVFVAWGIFTPVKVTHHLGRGTILTLRSALSIVECKEVIWLKGTPSFCFFRFSPKISSVLDHFHDPVPCKPSQVGMNSRVGRWQTSLNCLAFVLHRKKNASLGLENWGYQSRNRATCECRSTDTAGIILE